MIAIGVDAHKRLHAALALDDLGTVLGSWRSPNTVTGWMELRQWARQWSQPQHWGIEGAWNYGRGLAQFLVADGEIVYEINPRWTAERRRRTRKVDKNDHLDAHAVARLVREDGPRFHWVVVSCGRLLCLNGKWRGRCSVIGVQVSDLPRQDGIGTDGRSTFPHPTGWAQ